MKPDSNSPGVPFNFDAIPLWLKPNLWDETKMVRCRGMLFIALYTLSFSAFMAILAIPVGIYKGVNETATTVLVWIAVSFPGGVMLGLAAWWDFTRARRRIVAETASTQHAEKPSDASEGNKNNVNEKNNS